MSSPLVPALDLTEGSLAFKALTAKSGIDFASQHREPRHIHVFHFESHPERTDKRCFQRGRCIKTTERSALCSYRENALLFWLGICTQIWSYGTRRCGSGRSAPRSRS